VSFVLAIQSLGEDYEVFIVTDASGGVTAAAHQKLESISAIDLMKYN
jgi:hypothetical protein